MESQLKELFGFLHDRNPDARQLAVNHLTGHTTKESPHRHLFLESSGRDGTDSHVIRDLKLLCRDKLAIAHDAFCCLVNLSDSAELSQSLSEESFMRFLVSYIINPTSKLADLAAMLISNVTVSEAIALSMTKMKVPVYFEPRLYTPLSRSATSPWPDHLPEEEPKEVSALLLLIDAFVQGASKQTGEAKALREGSLHFISSLLSNISVIPEGREFFVTPARSTANGSLEYPLASLVIFTQHEDKIRRGGVTSTIKNCAFNASAHKAILTPDSMSVAVPPFNTEAPGIDALQYILLPLAGPEEFDLEEQEKLPISLQFLPDSKMRETDAALRLRHVETLLLLCTTRWGRDHLRTHGTYEVVRLCHENETVDEISEHIERLVNLLQRDEDPNAEIDDLSQGGPDEDDIIEEV